MLNFKNTLFNVSLVGLVFFATPLLSLGSPVQCSEIFRESEISLDPLRTGNPVKMVEQHRFKTYRGLDEYFNFLSDSFFNHLITITRRNGLRQWNDFGAGEGYALFQMRDRTKVDRDEVYDDNPVALSRLETFYSETQPNQRPHGLGFTFKRNEIPGGLEAWQNPSLRMREGDFGKLRFSRKDRFDLGTDLFGILEYTTRLDLAIAEMIGLMKPGAKLFAFVGSVDISKPAHSSLQKDFVTLLDGTKVRLRDWFERIDGDVHITYEPNHQGNRLTMVITRIGNGKVWVPELAIIPPPMPHPFAGVRSRRAFEETGEYIEVDLQ